MSGSLEEMILAEKTIPDKNSSKSTVDSSVDSPDQQGVVEQSGGPPLKKRKQNFDADDVSVVTTTTIVNPNKTVNIILGDLQAEHLDISQTLAADSAQDSAQDLYQFKTTTDNNDLDGTLDNNSFKHTSNLDTKHDNVDNVSSTLAWMNDSGIMEIDSEGNPLVDPNKAVDLIMSNISNIEMAEKLLSMDLDKLDPKTAAKLLQNMLTHGDDGTSTTDIIPGGPEGVPSASSTIADIHDGTSATNNITNDGGTTIGTTTSTEATAIKNTTTIPPTNPLRNLKSSGSSVTNSSFVSSTTRERAGSAGSISDTMLDSSLPADVSFFESLPLLDTAQQQQRNGHESKDNSQDSELGEGSSFLELLAALDGISEAEQLILLRSLILEKKKGRYLREALDPIVIHATRTNAGVVGINNEPTKFTDSTGRTRYIGRIKSYARDKGNNSYGFVECPEIYEKYRGDAFLRRDEYLDCFEVGDKVSFILEISKDRKPQAVNLMTMDCSVTPAFKESVRRREEEQYYREMFGSNYKRPAAGGPPNANSIAGQRSGAPQYGGGGVQQYGGGPGGAPQTGQTSSYGQQPSSYNAYYGSNSYNKNSSYGASNNKGQANNSSYETNKPVEMYNPESLPSPNLKISHSSNLQASSPIKNTDSTAAVAGSSAASTVTDLIANLTAHNALSHKNELTPEIQTDFTNDTDLTNNPFHCSKGDFGESNDSGKLNDLNKEGHSFSSILDSSSSGLNLDSAVVDSAVVDSAVQSVMMRAGGAAIASSGRGGGGGAGGAPGSLEEILANINAAHKEAHGVNDIPRSNPSNTSVNRFNPELTPRSRIRAPPEHREGICPVPKRGEKPRSESAPHYSQYELRNINAERFSDLVALTNPPPPPPLSVMLGMVPPPPLVGVVPPPWMDGNSRMDRADRLDRSDRPDNSRKPPRPLGARDPPKPLGKAEQDDGPMEDGPSSIFVKDDECV